MKKLQLILVLGLFLFSLGSTALYSQERVKNTPFFTLDLFLGNKKIQDQNIDTSLETNGLTLDYHLLPNYNISIIGGYLISKNGDSKKTTLSVNCPSLGTDILDNIPTATDPSNDTSEEYPTVSEGEKCEQTFVSIQGIEFSVGGRYHYNYNIDRGSDLDIFGGAGFVQIAIDTVNIENQRENANSEVGTYFELGIKYIYQNRFNGGLYLRHSSVSFETGGDANLQESGEVNWGGTTAGLIFGYTF